MRGYNKIKLVYTIPNLVGEDKSYFEVGDSHGCVAITKSGDEYVLRFERGDRQRMFEIHSSLVAWSEPAPLVKKVAPVAESGQA